jgi:triacylglycerol lipase
MTIFARTLRHGTMILAALVAFWGTPVHAQSTYAQTKYPIILVHGFSGTDSWFGLIDYWWGIPADLRSNGAKVYVANLSGFQSELGPNGRGEQLLAYVKQVKLLTGASKVNLIGHSQGGLSARYVGQVAPGSVASITTIATPHYEDPALGKIIMAPLDADPTGIASIAAAAFFNMFGIASSSSFNTNQDFLALKSFFKYDFNTFTRTYSAAGLGPRGTCTTGAATQTIAGHTHRLYSWTGHAIQKKTVLFASVIVDTSLGIVDPAPALDATTGLTYGLGAILINHYGTGTNDGAVPVCDAKFGSYLGSYAWNHFDEINNLLGVVGANGANPKSVIRSHANRLKLAGL